MYMYVYIYIYIYVCVYIYILYICIYLYMYMCRESSFRKTKSGAGEQFLLQDSRAEAAVNGVFRVRYQVVVRLWPAPRAPGALPV